MYNGTMIEKKLDGSRNSAVWHRSIRLNCSNAQKHFNIHLLWWFLLHLYFHIIIDEITMLTCTVEENSGVEDDEPYVKLRRSQRDVQSSTPGKQGIWRRIC